VALSGVADALGDLDQRLDHLGGVELAVAVLGQQLLHLVLELARLQVVGLDAYCGAESRFVRFNKANPSPRLWYRCADGAATLNCSKTQSISCATDWRLLVPLWRNTETYLALRDAHQRYERVHHHCARATASAPTTTSCAPSAAVSPASSCAPMPPCSSSG
jgi:hypothetical protein